MYLAEVKLIPELHKFVVQQVVVVRAVEEAVHNAAVVQLDT